MAFMAWLEAMWASEAGRMQLRDLGASVWTACELIDGNTCVDSRNGESHKQLTLATTKYWTLGCHD